MIAPTRERHYDVLRTEIDMRLIPKLISIKYKCNSECKSNSKFSANHENNENDQDNENHQDNKKEGN